MRKLSLATAASAATAALLLAACSGGSEEPTIPERTDAPTTLSAEPTTEAPVTAEPTEEPTTDKPIDEQTKEPGEPPVELEPFEIRPGDDPIGSDDFPGAGGDLFLVDADATTRDIGYQTMFTFTGNDALSWQAEFVDAAYQQGSGFEIDMGDSEYILQITVTGMRMPESTEEVITDVDTSESGLPEAVIHIDPPFEGMSVIYIGVPRTEFASIQILEEEGQTILYALL